MGGGLSLITEITMKRVSFTKTPWWGNIFFGVDLMLKFLGIPIDSFPVLHVGWEKKGLKEGKRDEFFWEFEVCVEGSNVN